MKNKRKTATRETEKMPLISVSSVFRRCKLTYHQSFQSRLKEEREFPVFICFSSARFNLSQGDWIGYFCLDMTTDAVVSAAFKHRFSAEQ